VFGPVPVQDLQQWARDCRIGPSHMVSRDKESWQSAPSLPALCMEWDVTLVDGATFGPIPLLAVRHMVDDLLNGPDATVEHSVIDLAFPARALIDPVASGG